MGGAVICTWWGVWVVSWEGHRSLEIAAVVKRVLVQYDQCDIPPEDIFVVKLEDMVVSLDPCRSLDLIFDRVAKSLVR